MNRSYTPKDISKPYRMAWMKPYHILLLDTMLTYPVWVSEHQLFGYVYVYNMIKPLHGMPTKTYEQKLRAKAFTFNRMFLDFKRQIRKHPLLTIEWKSEPPLVLYKLEKRDKVVEIWH